MKRAIAVRRTGALDRSLIVDRITLDAGERHRRRVVLRGENGTTFLLDLPNAEVLRTGDSLVLEDGSIVQVAAKSEALVEIAAANAAAQARLAWHLGNRHCEVQICGDRLRIRRDHVLEELLRGLGAVLTPLEAPFEPERGAYDCPHDEREFHM